MATEGLLTLILVMLVLVLAIAVIGVVGVWIVAQRWRRTREDKRSSRRRATSRQLQDTPSSVASPALHPMAGMGPDRSSSSTAADVVTHGDIPLGDPRILALGLEDPSSVEAVFRNIERVKPLLRAEAAESDRIARTTPLAGAALRATGAFLWGFPEQRGGLSVSYEARLEAVTQIARIDVGMAWVMSWLTAHGDMAGWLDDDTFAEIYPDGGLPTVFSATPLARAVEISGDRYRIEPAKWRLGSGGYHADRWLAGANVWDADGQPVMCDITGEQKTIGVWLPNESVRQHNDWDPLGVRSSGSASYQLTDTVEVPRRWSFNLGADRRPHFFPFMGVLVGAAQHMIDLTTEVVAAKQRAGGTLGGYDLTRLTRAMTSLDMLVLGLRGYASHIDEIVSGTRETRSPTVGETAWLESVGMPVRDTVLSIREVTADIYGTGYVNASSEFGRVLRDVQVALAHAWFRQSDTQADRSERLRLVLEGSPTFSIWDYGWPTEIPAKDGTPRASS